MISPFLKRVKQHFLADSGVYHYNHISDSYFVGGLLKLSKLFKVVLLITLLTPLYGNSLEWNHIADTTTLELSSKVGSTYVAQLIYQGEGGSTIGVSNIGPLPYGEMSDRFYYTHQNFIPGRDSPYNRWQRVLFGVTIKGQRHSSGKVEILSEDVLQYSGDTFSIPTGAGNDLLPNPGFVEGFNSEGVWGKGSNFRYKYPYEFITIELRAIATTEGNLIGGIYESHLYFSGAGFSLTLPLEGRRAESSELEDHSFSIERVVPQLLPFEQLIEKDSFTNRLRVGVIKYSSFETGATLSFASDASNSAVDFKLSSTKSSFPFSLVFESNNGAQKITDTSYGFSTTTHQLTTIAPTYTEVVNEHLLSGEVGIYVDKDLRKSRLPDDFYSTEIYFIVTSW